MTAEGYFGEMPGARGYHFVRSGGSQLSQGYYIQAGTTATDTEFSEIFTKSHVDLFLLPSHMLKALNYIFLPFYIFLTFSFVMQSGSLRG